MNRRHVLRLFVGLLAALVALVAIGVAALPVLVRRAVVWSLTSSLDRHVALAAVDVDLVGGRIAFHSLRIDDRDHQPLATMERLEAHFRPADLLRGHLRIVDGTVVAPAIRIVRTGPGEFNVSDLLRRPREGSGPGAFAVTIERFTVARAAIDVEDRTLAPPRVWRLQDLTIDARSVSMDPDAPAGILTVHGVAAGSPVSVWMTGLRLRPLAFHATVIAREVDGTLAALYLPPDGPFALRRATVDLSGAVRQDPAEGMSATLDVGLANVELRRPGHEDTDVAAPAIRVTVEDLRIRAGGVQLARVEIDAGTIAMRDTRANPPRRWQADGVFVEVRGLSTARDVPPGVATVRAVVAGSPVSAWVTNLRLAPLELHATAIARNVDITLVRAYLPADAPAQPERGAIDATVRLDHDARGHTAMHVDAALRDLEVRRPAHVVRVPAVRVTANDIGFDRGGMTVARATVNAERASIDDRTVTPMRTWPVQDLAVEATRLSSRGGDVQGVATVRAIVAGATASAWVTGLRLDPLELSVTAIVRDLELALARIYVPPAAAMEPTAGRVNASIQLRHSAKDGTVVTGDAVVTGMEARARDVNGLRVSAPSLRVTIADGRHQGEAWGIGRFEVTTQGVVTDPGAGNARYEFTQVRIAGQDVTWPSRGPAPIELRARLRQGGDLDVRGTAELTAGPPNVGATAELDVTLASLDLAPISTYVPAARGLAGEASARVKASLAYAGTLTARARGTLQINRVALADADDAPVTAAGITVSDLDVQWPDRITAAKVHVVQPRLRVDRDREGQFPLLARFASEPAPTAPEGAPPGTARTGPHVSVGEIALEKGRVTLVDRSVPGPARIEVQGVNLSVRDATWPGKTPVRVRFHGRFERAGLVDVEGSVGGEPARVNAQVVLTNAPLVLVRPYLGIAGEIVRGRVSTTLTVTGSLAPTLSLTARGQASGRRIAVTDPSRTVLTLEEIDIAGIDAAWPGRVTLDTVRVRTPWARIERDRQGEFVLMNVFRRPPRPARRRAGSPAPPPATPPPAAPTPPIEFRVRDAVIEDSSATIEDATTTPAAQIDVAGARLAVQELTWPARNPVKLQLTAPMPGGGNLDVAGTLELEPMRLDVRAALRQIEIGTAQPYLPIAGRVTGRMTGDIAMKMTLEPLTVKIDGDASLHRFKLAEGDRALVAVTRMETSGIDVDWPRRVAVKAIELRRPRLLVERDAKGDFELAALLTPRWEGTPAAASAGGPRPEGRPERAAAPSASPPTTPSAPAAAPAIEIGTLSLVRASGRFVDHTTAPAYAEELTEVDLALTGLTTAPAQRVRFTSKGAMPGGSSFSTEGEVTTGDRRHVDVKVELRDVVIPRANAYIEKYTSWTATRGSLTATASYTLDGSQITARHEVVVRGVEVRQASEHDEVERRLGLPLAFLVSLMKDARGEIRLSVPVAGDLSSREFDFTEAVWSAVRSLTVRLLALPFSRIGSLFVREDAKVEAVAITPVVFAAGTTDLGVDMVTHLDRIAVLMRDKPDLKLGLLPVVTVADAAPLKRAKIRAGLGIPPGAAAAEVLEAARNDFRARWPNRPTPEGLEAILDALAENDPPPNDLLRDLRARRLDTVRQMLDRRGVDPQRLTTTQRRTGLIEASGAGRVELDLVP